MQNLKSAPSLVPGPRKPGPRKIAFHTRLCFIKLHQPRFVSRPSSFSPKKTLHGTNGGKRDFSRTSLPFRSMGAAVCPAMTMPNLLLNWDCGWRNFVGQFHIPKSAIHIRGCHASSTGVGVQRVGRVSGSPSESQSPRSIEPKPPVTPSHR